MGLVTILAGAGQAASTTGCVVALTSARTLPGRQFAAGPEAELGDDIHRLVMKMTDARRKGVLLISELPGPFGIVDYAAVIPNRSALVARLKTQLAPLLLEVEAAVVAATPCFRPWFTSTIARRLGWPMARVEERLRSLRRLGVVAGGSNTGWVRHEAFQPIGRLHVIEAKVRDWRSATNQAYTYAAWADSVSLLLGQLPAAGVPTEIPYWIGCAVDGAWLRRPIIRQHHKARRLWASEHVIAAIADHQPSAMA